MHDHGVDPDPLERLQARVGGKPRSQAPEHAGQQRRVGRVAFDDRLPVIGREVHVEGLLPHETLAPDRKLGQRMSAIVGEPRIDRRHGVSDRERLGVREGRDVLEGNGHGQQRGHQG